MAYGHQTFIKKSFPNVLANLVVFFDLLALKLWVLLRILQQLHSKTVLAQIGEFLHNKTPFSHNSHMKSLEFYKNNITLFCLEKRNF